MVSKTSIEAYNAIVSDGTRLKQHEKVIKCIEVSGRLTRRQIGKITGLELGAVSGRVNKLIEDNVLMEVGTAVCETTKKTVHLVGFKGEFQRELFK